MIIHRILKKLESESCAWCTTANNQERSAGSTSVHAEPIDIELGVELLHSEDPEFIPEAERYKLADEEVEKYCASLEGSKIGGIPGFMQGDEYPGERENWMFLMQLDSCAVPFFVNFGDAGIAYVFINRERTIGKFLWQCA